jgi:hypothetical protein
MGQDEPDQRSANAAETGPESRFRHLPERVAPDEMVEEHPQPPRPEPAYDENVEAIRWYGLPL